MAIGSDWHRRLSNLKAQRGEIPATYAQAGKRDRLIIELTQRVAEISHVYVSTGERLEPLPLRLPPKDAPDQEWLIPRPNAPSDGAERSKRGEIR